MKGISMVSITLENLWFGAFAWTIFFWICLEIRGPTVDQLASCFLPLGHLKGIGQF